MGVKKSLTGSPYQVESFRRKYAIEHENYNYNTVRSVDDRCPYLAKTGNFCLLWNSGFKYCRDYKCAYFNQKFKKDCTCKECIYFSIKCRRSQKKQKINSAAYCCFFIKNAPGEDLYTIYTNLQKQLDELERQKQRILLNINNMQEFYKNPTISKKSKGRCTVKIRKGRKKVQELDGKIASISKKCLQYRHIS